MQIRSQAQQWGASPHPPASERFRGTLLTTLWAGRGRAEKGEEEPSFTTVNSQVQPVSVSDEWPPLTFLARENPEIVYQFL